MILFLQIEALVVSLGVSLELEAIVGDIWQKYLIQSYQTLSNSGKTRKRKATVVEEEEDDENFFASVIPIPRLLHALAMCYMGLLHLRAPISPQDFSQ
jgi:hypothetical protein